MAKATTAQKQSSTAPAARMHTHYRESVVPELTKKFGYKSVMQVPRIEKIVLNMGVGEATGDKKFLENAVADMQKISGQKPVITKAKKAIAGFKIRTGYPIGCMVTLRQDRMYEFLDRLVSVALPRVRDFRGVSGRAFDGRGNYNMGVKEQIIFPEIEYDKIDALRGMNITITTTAKTDAEAKALLTAFKLPIPGPVKSIDSPGAVDRVVGFEVGAQMVMWLERIGSVEKVVRDRGSSCPIGHKHAGVLRRRQPHYAQPGTIAPSHALVTTHSTSCDRRKDSRSGRDTGVTKTTDCPRYRTPSLSTNPRYR